jgi:antitoxin VapB
MGMNIKNEEAHRLASQLASLYDETLTEAVTVALRERLARAEVSDRREKTLELIKQMQKLYKGGPTREELDDMLYDDLGLPK